MDKISAWLCPTEQHRVRAREAGARVRAARTVAAVACGIALVAIVPFQGWWILVLLAATAVILGTFEMRLRRSKRPELVAVQSMLVILAFIAVGVAFSGGEDSPALPWLVLPGDHCGGSLQAAGAWWSGPALTAAVMFGLSVGVDAQALVDDPTRLISALTLLVGHHGDRQRAHGGRARASRPGRAGPAHRPSEPLVARVACGGDRAAGAPHRRRRSRSCCSTWTASSA